MTGDDEDPLPSLQLALRRVVHRAAHELPR